ncbi:MAG: TolC family protein [Spirochaetia bacterium]|nr:TolC family protein [Spirochaetia bacterium]
MIKKLIQTAFFFYVIIILGGLTYAPVFALDIVNTDKPLQNENADVENKTAKDVEPSEVSQNTGNSSPATTLNLTLDSAIQLVLHNNLTLKSAKFDVLMSDTDFENYLQKYSIRLNADGSYLNQQVPVSGLASSFGGDKTTQYDAGLSVSKIFSTGTMLSLGVKENLYDQNDLAIPNLKPNEDPPFHKPSLFFSVQQDLLKNAFGIADRKNMAILKNITEMRRDAYISQLSGLIVSALVDYWQVIIQESALKNSKKGLDATIQIRDIVGRNSSYGLTDSFELNQYQSLVAAAKSRYALSEFQRDQAMRKLLRTINMPSDTKIQGVTELVEELPVLNLQESIEIALRKRVDYKNILREIEVNELNLSLANHNALPSLTGFFTISTLGQSDIFSTAFADSVSAKYPTWKIGVSASYPLWDKGVKTAIRNASFKVEQSRIKLVQLKKEVEDEVTEKYQAVQLQYKVLVNTKTVMKESQIYYEKIMQNAQKGRFNSIVVKNALDSIVDARQRVLESLVQYNIALLQFDLAKNEIFERYNIDIVELLKNLK